jgi:hypothetical protein
MKMVLIFGYLKKIKMGYLTNFELEVTSNKYDGNDIIDNFIRENTSAEFALEGEAIKWYDHEKDLKDFSKKYPDEIFTLTGIGEEFPDAWKLYVKNGKSQLCKAEITYPKFDESKLS